MTMNVNLSPQLEAMVKAKVASGRTTSASEVVREALRLMEQQDQLRLWQFEQLRRDIQDGLASGEAQSRPKGAAAWGSMPIQGWACEPNDERGMSA
jgi:antitoxin ParD1/3/4